MAKRIFDKVKEMQKEDEDIVRLVWSATLLDNDGNKLEKENEIYTLLTKMCINSKDHSDGVLVELYPNELEKFYKENNYELNATLISTNRIKALKCIEGKIALVILFGKEKLKFDEIEKLNLDKAKHVILSMAIDNDLETKAKILVLTNKD